MILSASAAASLCQWCLFACQFIEVRILVGTQKNFFPFRNSFVAGLVAGVDSFLYASAFDSLEHAAFVFYLQEKFPGLLCDGSRKVFDIVRTCSRIDDTIEVSFFLQQELLVACNTFGEIIRCFVSLVKRSDGD